MSAKTLRRQCRHPNRIELRTLAEVVVRYHCPDCGATWPALQQWKSAAR